MTRFPLDIALYSEGLPFDGSPIENQSIGGSESAVWFMARALAGRGHRVTVFNACEKPGRYDGVTYRHFLELKQLATGEEVDLFIVCRFFQALMAPIRANLKWLWTHDVPSKATGQMAVAGAFADQMIALSDYHCGLYHPLKDTLADQAVWSEKLRSGFLWQSRNGVDIGLLRRATKHVQRHPKRMIYASRPERGLDFLLGKVWPALKEYDPDLELVVCSYDVSKLPGMDPQLRGYYQHLDAVMRQMPGVTQYGSLTKKAFYQLLASCQLMLYPTRFPEISCVSALESMALGVPIVTTHDFALPETIPYGGVHVEDGSLAPSDTYLRAFVDTTIECLRDELHYRRVSQQGCEWVEQRYQWKQIAEEWETRAFEQFEARKATKGRRICEKLLYDSAVVAAHQMAVAEGYTELAETAATMLQQHHTDPDDYDRAGAAQRDGWDQPGTRWAAMAAHLPPAGKQRLKILDVGCGAGGFLGCALKDRPDLDAVGIDFSPALVDQTKAFLLEHGWQERAGAQVVNAETAGGFPGGYDAVFAGEILEHMADPTAFIAELERYGRPGGTVVLSVPNGPWESASFGHTPSLATNRPHVQDFRRRDLEDLFGQKANLAVDFIHGAATKRNEAVGWWIIRYTIDPKRATGKLDYRRRWLVERPMQRIALCMIVKDGARDIRNCIDSVVDVVDEIHIFLDSRTSDKTREILAEYDGRYVPHLYVREGTFENFAQARNASIAHVDAEWILWLDSDEIVSKACFLRRYLETTFFDGYVIEQHHQTLDIGRAPRADRPIRIFRAGVGHQFYGHLHENPGRSLNVEVQPAMIIQDVRIVHFGYLDEAIRRTKMVTRNMGLLREDRLANPTRKQGPFLVARDYLTMARWGMETAGGQMTEQSLGYIREAIALYRLWYAKTDDAFHEYAYEVYQEALEFLAGRGLEAVPGLGIPIQGSYQCNASRSGALQDPNLTQPLIRWFADRAELRDFLIERGDFAYRELDPLAGLTRRSTVLPFVTATNGNGIAHSAAHALAHERVDGTDEGAPAPERLQAPDEAR